MIRRLIILLLIIGCEEPAIDGCTASNACNYNADATKEDGNCISPQGCNNWCEGDSLSVQELDCVEVCGGESVIDDCGICTGGTTGLAVNYLKDCAGTCNGNSVEDECGLCGGNGIPNGACDCAGNIDIGCGCGFIAISGTCYYQNDLNVLQQLIDNSQQGDNPPSSDLSPLDLGNQFWQEGRLVEFCCTSSANLLEADYCTNQNYELSGEIPAGIWELDQLTYLNLNHNSKLYGQIPPHYR